MKATDSALIYKVCETAEWRAAKAAGTYGGAKVDLADGFIHFSTAGQLRETVRRYFAGNGNLMLIEVKVAALTDELKWEPSRGGDLFPHLYGDLPMAAVSRAWAFPLGADGTRQFPREVEFPDG
jgi:uncharacterized protein (DUF952 family)